MTKEYIWLKNANNINSEHNVPALYQTMSSLLDCIKENHDDMAKINELLLKIDIKNASFTHAVCVLRSLSSKKEELPCWEILRNNLIKEYHIRGMQKPLHIMMHGVL